MASDLIIMDGDSVNFIPVCGAAIVAVKPGKMKASGKTTINGKKVCVEGDEKNVAVTGCTYMTPAYPVPGAGTLKIKALAPNQLTQTARSGNKSMILKGAMFDAVFEVQSPAKLIVPPGPPQSDPASSYAGKGQLIPNNNKVKAV